jgi:DNA-binding GntR family transcriptional regulator
VTEGGRSERLPHSSLGDEVYRLLWKRILDRGLRPGDKLSDLHLSHELGVSRTPMREALRRLVSDGIVQAERNRGFFVASFSASDIAEIYDLRATLETMALRVARRS